MFATKPNLLVVDAVHQAALGGGAVNITVPAGQIWVIKSFKITGVTLDVLVEMSIDGTLRYWAPGGANFSPFEPVVDSGMFRKTQEVGQFTSGTPIMCAVAGQVITMVSGDNTGTVRMYFDIHSLAAPFSRGSVGGDLAAERIYYSYSVHVEAVDAGLTVTIDLVTSLNPVGETGWPWLGTVRAGRQYELLAMYIPYSDVVGTNLTRSWVQILHNTYDLLSAPALNVGNLWTNPHNMNPSYKLKIFNPPQMFKAGEAATVNMRVASTDPGQQNATLRCLLLIKDSPLGYHG